MTDAHQDVAGLVSRSRQAHENSQQRIVGSDIFQCAADRLESLSQALREAEAQADKYCEWWREKRNECMAAESRLAEVEADRDRISRNRDMWKGQVERQAEQLAKLRVELSKLEAQNADV